MTKTKSNDHMPNLGPPTRIPRTGEPPPLPVSDANIKEAVKYIKAQNNRDAERNGPPRRPLQHLGD